MDIDLPYLLFQAVVVSSLIIMADLLFLKSRREKSTSSYSVVDEKPGKNEGSSYATQTSRICLLLFFQSYY